MDETEYLAEEILNLNPFVAEANFTLQHFEASVLQEVNFHIANNPKYANFISRKLDGRELSFENLPPVPAQVFKEMGSALASVPEAEVRFSLQSSATSGIPSTVVVDSLTAKRQARAMTKVMQEVLGSEKSPMLVVDVEPSPINRAALGARFAAVVGYLKFASSHSYLLELDQSGGLILSPKATEILSKIQQDSTPVVVFGFTYVLYRAMLDSLAKSGQTFRLPEGSKIIHIGGWKKLENEKISPSEFKQLAHEVLGVSPTNIVDVYGFTEQMGLNYPECRVGWKHVPAYSQLRVLDSESNLPVLAGVSGLLEFTTPIPHSYPGNRIVTDDLGYLNPADECDCGWSGQSFKITGRRKNAEIRGCGDILGESVASSSFSQSLKNSDAVAIEFPRSLEYLTQGKDPIGAIAAQLEAQTKTLATLSVSEIIAGITQLRSVWIEMQASGELASLRNHGLGFLIEWSSATNLRKILELGVRGGVSSLDGFVSSDNARNRYLHNQSRGLVCQWVSGNVPMLGMFALLQAWMSKSPSLIRISSTGEDMLAILLRPLEDLALKNKACENLLNSVVIVSFDRENESANSSMSLAARTRIAWGGANAISAITSLPKQIDAVDLVFGPKTSFQVISEEFLENEAQIRRMSRKVAADTFVFNQIACASPHSIFVCTDNEDLIQRFGREIDAQMGNAENIFPHLNMDEALAAQIRLARAVADFTGWSLGPSDLSHSVLYSESSGLPLPSFGRTLVLKKVSDESEVVDLIHTQVQSIGLALPESRKWRFAIAAASRGAIRFPEIGKMTNFDSPWDGKYMFDAFLKAVVVGGPNQY